VSGAFLDASLSIFCIEAGLSLSSFMPKMILTSGQYSRTCLT
jgi:hypothetical protein